VNAIHIRPLHAEEWSSFKEFRLAALKLAPGMFAASYDEALARSPETWQHLIAGPRHQVFGLFDGTVRVSNEASQRACQNFGFEYIRRAPRLWPDGTTGDELVYELCLAGV